MKEDNRIVVVHPAVQGVIANMKSDKKSNESIWKKPTEEQHTIIMGEFNKEHFIRRFLEKEANFIRQLNVKNIFAVLVPFLICTLDIINIFLHIILM